MSRLLANSYLLVLNETFLRSPGGDHHIITRFYCLSGRTGRERCICKIFKPRSGPPRGPFQYSLFDTGVDVRHPVIAIGTRTSSDTTLILLSIVIENMEREK
jgi:hypothetical protein